MTQSLLNYCPRPDHSCVEWNATQPGTFARGTIAPFYVRLKYETKFDLCDRWLTMLWNCPRSTKLRMSLLGRLAEHRLCQPNCKELPTKLQRTSVTGSIGHNRASTMEDLDVRHSWLLLGQFHSMVNHRSHTLRGGGHKLKNLKGRGAPPGTPPLATCLTEAYWFQ